MIKVVDVLLLIFLYQLWGMRERGVNPEVCLQVCARAWMRAKFSHTSRNFQDSRTNLPHCISLLSVKLLYCHVRILKKESERHVTILF